MTKRGKLKLVHGTVEKKEKSPSYAPMTKEEWKQFLLLDEAEDE